MSFEFFFFVGGFIKVHDGNSDEGGKFPHVRELALVFPPSSAVSSILNFDIFCDFSRSIARLKCLWWELEHDFYQRNWRYHKLFPRYYSRLCTIFDRHMSRMFARRDIKRQWMLETQTGSIVELILLFFPYTTTTQHNIWAKKSVLSHFVKVVQQRRASTASLGLAVRMEANMKCCEPC